MTRTITVAQPGLIDSTLSLHEEGTTLDGTIVFGGLFKSCAQLELGSQLLTFTTVGLLGRTVRADSANGSAIGEFRQTGILGRGIAAVNGRHYRLKVSGVLARQYHWIADDDTEAMSLSLGGVLRTHGSIQIPDTAVPDDSIVLIGLGLITRRAMESDSGGGAAGAN